MIEKLTNFTYKSFKNFTGPDLAFKQRNVIFGYNGKGKSSLSKGIKDEFLKSNLEENFRGYDQDYITSNLTIDDSTHIKGVKATFGKGNVDIEEKIKELTKEIVDTFGDLKKIESLVKEINDRINAIFDDRKGTLNIRKKGFSEDIDSLLSSFEKDYQDAHKIVADDNELSAIKGDDKAEKALEELRSFTIPSLILNFADDKFEKSFDLFNKTFGNENIPSSDIINWIKQGVQLHKEGDGCLFCGNKSLDLEEIKTNLDSFLKNEKQIASTTLAQYKECFVALIDGIVAIEKNKVTFSKFLGNESNLIVDEIIGFKEPIQNTINLFIKKIENINDVISIDKDNIISTIEEVRSSYSKLQNLKTEKIKQLETQNSKLSTLVKGSIAYNILHDSLIYTKNKELKTKKKEIETALAKNKGIEQQIREQKAKKSNTSDFAMFISDILRDLEIDFKLDLVGDDYVIKSTQEGVELKVTDISEGERNLLSLLFFYYELFEDNEQKRFKNNIDLIIVDDPIFSVDDINKMFILSLMDKVLKLSKPQVFVFTHIWDDFNSLIYGKDDDRRTYEVVKDGGSSLRETKKYVTPYHHDFSEIFTFSQKTKSDSIDPSDIYHMPNTMRRVLEQFMAFKLSANTVPTGSNIENVKKVLFENPDSISPKEQLKTSVLVKICNVNSHKSARNPEELLSSAKFLMDRIKAMDKVHFDSMKTNA